MYKQTAGALAKNPKNYYTCAQIVTPAPRAAPRKKHEGKKKRGRSRNQDGAKVVSLEGGVLEYNMCKRGTLGQLVDLFRLSGFDFFKKIWYPLFFNSSCAQGYLISSCFCFMGERGQATGRGGIIGSLKPSAFTSHAGWTWDIAIVCCRKQAVHVARVLHV